MSLATVITLTLLAFVAMSIEAFVGHRSGRRVYRWDAMVANLSCSAGNLVSIGAFGLTGYLGYQTILDWVPWRIADVGNPVHWVLALLALDFVMWVRHWMCHRVGFLWAVHAVHHQAEDMNLGSAQRSPWLQAVQALPTSWALAALGLPMEILVASFGITVIWQLFVHTELVGKLGWVDRILVTPSVHRVHHACNEQYLDKNYGGVLAIWDVLLGTWELEDEAPVYGTLTGLESYDPLWANASPWLYLFKKAATAPTYLTALETLVRPPAWNPITRSECLYEGPKHTPTPVAPTTLPVRVALFAVALTFVIGLYALPPVSSSLMAVLGLCSWAGLSAVDRLSRGSQAVEPATRTLS